MEVLRLVLPVVWAVVASGVGWWLYRYSTAKLETRWVAFTGAAAIAAACFYGLYRATPRSLIERVPPGVVLVDESSLARIRDLVRDQARAIETAMTRCVAEVRQDENCEDALRSLRATVVQVQAAIDRTGHAE
jgi:hypothetical protein